MQLDHILLGIADLDRGIDQFEARTGVRPVYGGEHTSTPTHNALATLGSRQYIEILALRPDAPPDAPHSALMQTAVLSSLDTLTPLTWAVSTRDIDQTAQLLATQGYSVTDIQPGGRQQPDGSRLAWKVFGIAAPDRKTLPFFIQWEESFAHPAEKAPTGCHLDTLRLTDPEPGRMQQLMTKLGLRVRSEEGAPSMTVTLVGPEGQVTFSG